MQIITGRRYHAARSFATLIEMLRQSADQYGDLPAFKFRSTPKDTVQTRTYRQFLADVNALGTALKDLDLPNRRMAVFSDNGYGWALSFYSIINGNGIVVPLDKQLPEEEVQRLVARGKVDVLFYGRPQKGIVRAVLEKNPAVRLAVCLQEPEPALREVDPDLSAGRLAGLSAMIGRGRALLDQGDRRFLEAAINPQALASLLFTSGTTDCPKGVMLSQENLCSNIRSIAGILPIRPGEKLLSILPMHHTFENTAGLNYLLYCGGCICFNDGLRYFMQNMQEYQIEVMIAVPLLFENVYKKMKEKLQASRKDLLVRALRPAARLLCHGGIDVRRHLFRSILAAMGGQLRLVVVGAAAIDPEIVRAFTDFGIEFYVGYGLTEASPVITCCHQQNNVIGSVGPPLPDVTLAIDTQAQVSGVVGEILTRSSSVMLGYEENDAETAAVLTRDGWLRTGDMGFVDKAGALHLTGRIKSMIVLANGKKAFPEEIESLLEKVEGVAAAMVWGDERERESVDICALLQIEPGLLPGGLQNAADPDIGSWLGEQVKQINRQMPAYKAVKYVLFTEQDLVRTTTLKIRRQPQLDLVNDWLARMNLTMRQADGCRLAT